MEQRTGQSQRIEQGLNISPRLKKSLDILQKPAVELNKLIEEELLTNPLLEEAPEGEIYPEPKKEPENGDFEDEGESIYDSSAQDVPSESGEDASQLQKNRDFLINSVQDRVSLEQYLLNEAALDSKDDETIKAFTHLCGHLDDRGFLDADALESARKAGLDESAVQNALRLLRNSDPAGIGAFDMRDSLMLQLERAGNGESLAHRILQNHYDMLLKRKVGEIAKAEGRSESEVEDAIAQISKLHTSPAHEFSAEESQYVVPDLEFYKDSDGKWGVRTVSSSQPRLRINQEYRRMGAVGSLGNDDTAYIREKIREAKFILDAVDQRRKTLLGIGEQILSRQSGFFQKGVCALQPMKMQDVADALGLHATTIGRAVSGKYAETPFGTFALKKFFGGGFGEGEGMASSSVKEKIRGLVEAESPQKPLSDSELSKMLADDGLNVARRTVAKYREELGIAPKNIRKRF